MIEKFKTLFSEIRENESIDIKALELNDYAANAPDLEYVEGRKTVDKLFIDLYKELNGVVIDWAAKEARHDDVLGKAKILPFQESIVNWKGIVYFDDTPEDSIIRRFFPFDFFVDEACAGILATVEQKPNIYLYQFEGEPFDLKVDINGYCELLIEAKGFRYWQMMIKEILTGTENYNSKLVKEYLPQLFPEFSFKQFEDKFHTLYLR